MVRFSLPGTAAIGIGIAVVGDKSESQGGRVLPALLEIAASLTAAEAALAVIAAGTAPAWGLTLAALGLAAAVVGATTGSLYLSGTLTKEQDEAISNMLSRIANPPQLALWAGERALNVKEEYATALSKITTIFTTREMLEGIRGGGISGVKGGLGLYEWGKDLAYSANAWMLVGTGAGQGRGESFQKPGDEGALSTARPLTPKASSRDFLDRDGFALPRGGGPGRQSPTVASNERPGAGSRGIGETRTRTEAINDSGRGKPGLGDMGHGNMGKGGGGKGSGKGNTGGLSDKEFHSKTKPNL